MRGGFYTKVIASGPEGGCQQPAATKFEHAEIAKFCDTVRNTKTIKKGGG